MDRIGYLAHDLADPAVARRVRMFGMGGAEVALAGFLRGAVLPDLPPAGAALVLGRSADARLARRALGVARVLATGLGGLAAHLDGADALVARNLEMLVIARALQAQMGGRPRLVYECLDIHRLLTDAGAAGRALRGVEARLARHVDLLLTSSPAFVRHHLGRNFPPDRIRIVENKVLTEGPFAPPPPPPPGPPFRIGWFGALRCRRSFDLLSALAARLEGRVEVVLRGRPATTVFPDLAAEAARHPHLRYGGAYGAADLPALYGSVHFSWCIDFYEDGQNSAWLLPNRLYESAAHLAVPIALAEVETGRFLQQHGLGLVIRRHNLDSLVALIAAMTPDRHAALRAAIAATPPALWRAGPEEARALVAAVMGRTSDAWTGAA
ncbi:MAG: hypothetical protein RIR62_2837 [Pseudomonadota bacterium]